MFSAVLNHAYNAGLVDKPIRTGPGFKRPPQRVIRLHRDAKGPNLFTREDTYRILAACSPELRAMTLLGLNGGLGNQDCELLEKRHISDGWLELVRSKTGIGRRFPLWDETRPRRPRLKQRRPADRRASQRVFLTRTGHICTSAVVTAQFRKVLDKLEIHRKGLGFYILRHIFATAASGSRDAHAGITSWATLNATWVRTIGNKLKTNACNVSSSMSTTGCTETRNEYARSRPSLPRPSSRRHIRRG